MKVGDLIELSAHGKSLVMCCHRRGVVGLIVEILQERYKPNVYSVMWTDADKPQDRWYYSRRDLKYAKGRPHGE